MVVWLRPVEHDRPQSDRFGDVHVRIRLGHHVHAENELTEPDRFRLVVERARLQPGDPVLGRAQRRQDESVQRCPLLDLLLQQRQPVAVGQHPIENRRIVGGVVEQRPCALQRRRVVDRETVEGAPNHPSGRVTSTTRGR